MAVEIMERTMGSRKKSEQYLRRQFLRRDKLSENQITAILQITHDHVGPIAHMFLRMRDNLISQYNLRIEEANQNIADQLADFTDLDTVVHLDDIQVMTNWFQNHRADTRRRLTNDERTTVYAAIRAVALADIKEPKTPENDHSRVINERSVSRREEAYTKLHLEWGFRPPVARALVAHAGELWGLAAHLYEHLLEHFNSEIYLFEHENLAAAHGIMQVHFHLFSSQGEDLSKAVERMCGTHNFVMLEHPGFGNLREHDWIILFQAIHAAARDWLNDPPGYDSAEDLEEVLADTFLEPDSLSGQLERELGWRPLRRDEW